MQMLERPAYIDHSVILLSCKSKNPFVYEYAVLTSKEPILVLFS